MEEKMNQSLNYDIGVYSDPTQYKGDILVSKPASTKTIDIDTNKDFYSNIIAAGQSSRLDISKIESFTQVSNNRETIMELLDTMAEDPTIAAALEIYAEDATEPNDAGDIVWCVSDDSDVMSYVTYLLDTMNINKNIYKWVYSLCKYGDVYLRLYRESEYDDPIFNTKKKNLNENVVIKAYSENDKFTHFIDMVPNPAEVFELRRLGKSCGYIKANIAARQNTNDEMSYINSTYRYSFNRHDVEVYDATMFVHAALEDNSSRVPEEVELFLNENGTTLDTNTNTKVVYTVRRGQSLLYNIFKIWRMMSLLENSMLLNRVTKSSVVRLIGVEVADMPKENVGPHLLGVKQLFEQKSALDVGNNLSEYTNPGPIENNVYVPTHNGVGAISVQQVGGDVNVTGLDDVDYFKNKLYSSLRIPKQYLGDTDDPGGFNGGTSLSLTSSRYAKAIKRIQSTMCQAITDAVNIMLLDKGLDSYVNKFTIKMQSPTTQEEKDRKDSQSNQINMVQDIMNLLDGISIEDEAMKLRLLKALLGDIISDPEVIKLLEDEIEKLENQKEGENSLDDASNDGDIINDVDVGSGIHSVSPSTSELDAPSIEEPPEVVNIESDEVGNLPTPDELGIGDFSDNNNPEL